jgi:type IV pilus biogenesis protein CpaD/CtpE
MDQLPVPVRPHRTMLFLPLKGLLALVILVAGVAAACARPEPSEETPMYIATRPPIDRAAHKQTETAVFSLG